MGKAKSKWCSHLPMNIMRERERKMTVSELIRTKRAVRQFTNEPLSEEAMRTILDAGRRAQSSKNT
jgi:hypothetical protein